MRITVEPADWPLADRLPPLLHAAAGRLTLGDRLAGIALVLDALAVDEQPWLRLAGGAQERHLTIWLHPDQLLHDRAEARTAAARDWELGPLPPAEAGPVDGDFSLPNAQRVLYQQLLLVRDLLDGSLRPRTVDPTLSEAFQEAWLATVDGRLQRAGLPHLSAAQRRLRFLRLFAPAAVLTPGHWRVFNQLWEEDLPDQAAVLAKVRLLPPLGRRRRV